MTSIPRPIITSPIPISPSAGRRKPKRGISPPFGWTPDFLFPTSLYRRARRPDLAENILEDLVRKVPDRWEGYYNLGVVRHLEGDKARALELWRKGLEIDPLNKTILQAVQNFSGPHRKN